jgi:hypothetical protein
MAVATYRLRRIARIDAGYFDLRLRFQAVPEQFNQDGAADPLAWAFHTDSNGGQVFDRLSRYEARIQREYSRCLKDLQTLQAARKKSVVKTNPEPRVTPLKPTPSVNPEPPEAPAPQGPAPTPVPPDAEK